MSTINNAIFDHDSEDDNDSDFIPEEHSESSDEDAAGAAALTATEAVDKEAESIAQKQAREALWASFQSSVSNVAPGMSSAKPPTQVNLVKVERKYRFVGEMVSEVIEVPKDSDEAKKWPLWEPPATPATDTETSAEAKRLPEDSISLSVGNSTSDSPEPAVSSSATSEPSSVTGPLSSTLAAPPRRRPGPRKPKTTLAPLPQSKPKKLSTLEKSAMDWRAHITSALPDTDGEVPVGAESLADELERNRRGGGYLEKVAFLERVGDRREELFEDSRKKRRKG